MTENAEKPTAVAESVLITRPQLDLEMQIIDAGQMAFLSALKSRETLGSAFEIASQQSEGFDLSAAIVLMLQAELITKIET